MRWKPFALATAVCAVLATGAAPATAATLPTLPNPSSHGITYLGMSAVDPAAEVIDVRMRTQAVYRTGGTPEIKVRILLPTGYNPAAATPYEVLFLLHGGSGKWDDWGNNGVKDLVRNSPFKGIVVMPEGGSTGYYTNWAGQADGGYRPDWETFHIGQLLPWVDANFRTSGTRSGRYLAGLSMGGFGALKYGAQHHTKFAGVASFSGGTNMRPVEVQDTISSHMWMSGAAIRTVNFLDGGTRVNLYENGLLVLDQARQRKYRIETLFGPESNWPNVNPWDMSANFGTYEGKFALYSGGADGNGEKDIYKSNLDLRTKLGNIPHRWCAGNGDHSWPYWQRDLTDFLHYLNNTPIACHYTAGG
ncbi:alpha/beta hydrolase [Longispora albida]|uniref:alpha/beta hydrolase n=1 Tax=Longispora albida TaxID=203523 RepID=UPI000A03377A|nr:alpha/beta hydrolase-fold protein [Longispora albida]